MRFSLLVPYIFFPLSATAAPIYTSPAILSSPATLSPIQFHSDHVAVEESTTIAAKIYVSQSSEDRNWLQRRCLWCYIGAKTDIERQAAKDAIEAAGDTSSAKWIASNEELLRMDQIPQSPPARDMSDEAGHHRSEKRSTPFWDYEIEQPKWQAPPKKPSAIDEAGDEHSAKLVALEGGSYEIEQAPKSPPARETIDEAGGERSAKWVAPFGRPYWENVDEMMAPKWQAASKKPSELVPRMISSSVDIPVHQSQRRCPFCCFWCHAMELNKRPISPPARDTINEAGDEGSAKWVASKGGSYEIEQAPKLQAAPKEQSEIVPRMISSSVDTPVHQTQRRCFITCFWGSNMKIQISENAIKTNHKSSDEVASGSPILKSDTKGRKPAPPISPYNVEVSRPPSREPPSVYPPAPIKRAISTSPLHRRGCFWCSYKSNTPPEIIAGEKVAQLHANEIISDLRATADQEIVLVKANAAANRAKADARVAHAKTEAIATKARGKVDVKAAIAKHNAKIAGAKVDLKGAIAHDVADAQLKAALEAKKDGSPKSKRQDAKVRRAISPFSDTSEIHRLEGRPFWAPNFPKLRTDFPEMITDPATMISEAKEHLNEKGIGNNHFNRYTWTDVSTGLELPGQAPPKAKDIGTNEDLDRHLWTDVSTGLKLPGQVPPKAGSPGRLQERNPAKIP